MSVRRRAASVCRKQSCYTPPLLSLSHRRWSADLSVAPLQLGRCWVSLTDSQGPTTTAGLVNAKARLTSWPHLASAFCGKEKTWVDASWRHFSQLMTQNNIAITSRVKHQRLHFYLIVSNKQKNYSLPQFLLISSAPLWIVFCVFVHKCVVGTLLVR